MERLTGKIAATVTSRVVVINKGSQDGVTKGMRFRIPLYVPEIVDPDDPENVLSAFEYNKGTIVVTKVHQRMSFADVEETIEILSTRLWGAISVRPSVSAPMLPDDSWSLKRGDRVEQIV